MTTLLIGPADRTVTITVQQRTRTAPKDAFRILVPIDLPTVFRPVAPFPGISSVKNQIEAELTEYVPGSSFAYQITGFTNALSRLAAGIRGEFNVNPDGDGTLIRWTYEFKPLPGRRWILAGPFAPLWRRYMVAALARCVHVIETADSEQTPLRTG